MQGGLCMVNSLFLLVFNAFIFIACDATYVTDTAPSKSTNACSIGQSVDNTGQCVTCPVDQVMNTVGQCIEPLPEGGCHNSGCYTTADAVTVEAALAIPCCDGLTLNSYDNACTSSGQLGQSCGQEP